MRNCNRSSYSAQGSSPGLSHRKPAEAGSSALASARFIGLSFIHAGTRKSTSLPGEGLRYSSRRLKIRVLGRHVVSDPRICHGKPTFRGTRVRVEDVLEQVASGMTWEAIIKEWNRSVTVEAIRGNWRARLWPNTPMNLCWLQSPRERPR